MLFKIDSLYSFLKGQLTDVEGLFLLCKIKKAKFLLCYFVCTKNTLESNHSSIALNSQITTNAGEFVTAYQSCITFQKIMVQHAHELSVTITTLIKVALN